MDLYSSISRLNNPDKKIRMKQKRDENLMLEMDKLAKEFNVHTIKNKVLLKKV